MDIFFLLLLPEGEVQLPRVKCVAGKCRELDTSVFILSSHIFLSRPKKILFIIPKGSVSRYLYTYTGSASASSVGINDDNSNVFVFTL